MKSKNTDISNTEKVNKYMDKLRHPLKAEMEAVRYIIMKANSKVQEQIKWGHPSFFYKEGMATLDTKSLKYVHLIFHNGALIDDESGLLQGDYIDRRTVNFYNMEDIIAKKAILEKIVNEWVMIMDQYYNNLVSDISLSNNMNLQSEIKSTSDALIKVLDEFSQEDVNVAPFSGGWSAAQVADHVLQSITGVLTVLYGSTKKSNSAPDGKVEEIRALFLDFAIKMESPVEILPSELPQKKDHLVRLLREKCDGIYEAFRILNLSEICVNFEFPNWGPLTRLEWFNFFVVHTQRHTRQISNIKKLLDEEAKVKYETSKEIQNLKSGFENNLA